MYETIEISEGWVTFSTCASGGKAGVVVMDQFGCFDTRYVGNIYDGGRKAAYEREGYEGIGCKLCPLNTARAASWTFAGWEKPTNATAAKAYLHAKNAAMIACAAPALAYSEQYKYLRAEVKRLSYEHDRAYQLELADEPALYRSLVDAQKALQAHEANAPLDEVYRGQ